MPEPPSLPAVAGEPLSLVLVAHNAGPSLKDILADWRKVLDERGKPYEIIVVDDGSTDDTPVLLKEAPPEVRGERHEERKGFGAALRLGLAAVRHPLVCYCPADRQYDPADLNTLLARIDKVELVTGYRPGRPAPAWLRVGGFFVRTVARVALGIGLERSPCWLGWSGAVRRWFVRWVFGVFVCDPDCAFRLARRELLTRFPIQSAGSFAHSEIIAKANFMNAYIDQVAVTYRPPADSKSAVGLENPTWRDIRRVLSNPSFRPAPAVELG